MATPAVAWPSAANWAADNERSIECSSFVGLSSKPALHSLPRPTGNSRRRRGETRRACQELLRRPSIPLVAGPITNRECIRHCRSRRSRCIDSGTTDRVAGSTPMGADTNRTGLTVGRKGTPRAAPCGHHGCCKMHSKRHNLPWPDWAASRTIAASATLSHLPARSHPWRRRVCLIGRHGLTSHGTNRQETHCRCRHRREFHD